MTNDEALTRMRELSPRRNSTAALNADELVAEQLAHFGIDPHDEFGQTLTRITFRLYECRSDLGELWRLTFESIAGLEQKDKIARFNAKKFLSFQLAKLLDILQNPFRRSYQELDYSPATMLAKGPYPVFDNVTSLFSATPVIARTATYIYACAEWIEESFKGKELLLEIYSRLLNPTSVALANAIVDLEAGPYTAEYFAWNFNSGMAAIDGVLSHVLGRDDILITNQNLYGGTHQLMHDWFAKPSNLNVAVESFNGYDAESFQQCRQRVEEKYADRLAEGRRVYLFIESPCNPHGYTLDVPELCRAAHAANIRVILDGTVATPFLFRPLVREDPAERPDFLVHSYTKDISGGGTVIGGVAIGRNEDMFLPKGESANGVNWNDTLFWNVYFIKGAFLNADAAFEVMQGMRTLHVRMLTKCTNTQILANFLDSHPHITVHCNALSDDPNSGIRERLMFCGLPAPLFTIDMEKADVPKQAFQRFFDNLAPTFSHMISLGQSNTIVSCPGLTTHSELDADAQREANILPTTIRFSLGDEDPGDLIRHLVETARLTIDPDVPGFSARFPAAENANDLIRDISLKTHRRYVESRPPVTY